MPVGLFACCLTLLAAPTSQAEPPPNIVLILADDLGYGDLSCYNPDRGRIPTPHLDRLAQQGMRFTDAHAGSSVCSPTRYGLLTGRYAWRTRLQERVLQPYDPPLIAANRLTLGSLLRRHTYETACIGKWHLGWSWPRRNGEVVFDQRIADGPIDRGFGLYFGTDVPNYPPYAFIQDDRIRERLTAHKPKRDLDGRPGPMRPGWRFDAILPRLTEEATTFIRKRSLDRRKFFLYLPLTSPHEPIAPTPRFRGRSGVSLVGDFIMETDWAVGQVLEALEKHGLADNTLVIFTSDNGHTTYAEQEHAAQLRREGHINGHYPSGPWRGFKSDIWEGGHRVPMIVRWPGHVKAGSTSDALVCLTDWMATLAELLASRLPDAAGEDSISFLPVLLGTGPGRREVLVSHSGHGEFAIRRGNWKLIFCPGSGGFGGLPGDREAREQGLPPIQLYDLASDPGETRNLQAEHPERVRELTALLKDLIDRGRSTPGPRQNNDVPVRWEPPAPASQTSQPATAAE